MISSNEGGLGSFNEAERHSERAAACCSSLVDAASTHKPKPKSHFLDVALSFTFTMLKLAGFVDWSWLWVLSPIWISGLIAMWLGGLQRLLSEEA